MATWSCRVMREEGQTQRFPAVLLTTNSRIDGGVAMLEKLPSRVSRAGFRNEEQPTCEDAVEEGCTLSAGSTSLQLNGLLSSYQTQTQPQPHPGMFGFLGRKKVKAFRAEKPENAVLHILCEKKSESEMGEDDGSVLFAEDMDIRDSDSDSFYLEGLHSTDDEMEDDFFFDLKMENDRDDDSSEESDCFYEKLIVAEGSKQKQMGKYDVCEQPQWMEEDDGGIEGHTRSTGSTCFQLNEPPSFEGPEECKRIMKPSEEKVDILGDEDVVQVECGIVRNWACADFSYLSQEESRRFVTRIVDMCVAIGMEFTPSPIKEAQATPTDIEWTLVDLHGKIIDHLTKCGRKEEQLGLLLVILPEDGYSYDIVEGVCKTLGITFYYCCACEARYPSKGHLKRIAREIQSKVVMRDARLRRLALPLVSEAPMLFFGADIFRCMPGDEGSDYISSVATSLDWPKFRRYTVQVSHDEGAINVSARLGSMITEFIYSFSKITKRTVEKIIFFRNGLEDGQFGDFCHQEMSAIKTACAYFMDGYEPRITYVVVLPRAKMEMTNKSGTGADLIGYKFWCRHSGGKKFSTLVCYHVVHDENNFPPGELQSLTSKLCSIHDRRAYPEIDIVPPAFYARHDGMAALEEWGRTKRLTKFQSNL